MKIFITGIDGQLGQALKSALSGESVLAAPHATHDVSDPSIITAIVDCHPDVVIHAGALTDVDGCEKDEALAYRVNAVGTQHVATGAERAGAELVYISTDYVFDGLKGSPYREWDETRPINAYGRSKAAGEWAARHLVKRFYIVRSSWLYGRTGRNFVKTILRLAEERDQLRIVNDQTGNPTFVEPLAGAIARLIKSHEYGIYHAVSDDHASWYEFAKEILRLAGKQVPVVPITSAELGRPAPRPPFSALHNTALKALGIDLPSWKEQLEEYFR